MKRTLRNLLFSALTALLLLGGMEGVLRVLGWPDPGLYAGDPASVWWLRPSLPERAVPFPERGTTFGVRTSAAGFRGPEPEPGAWLALGDSTTFGWGVEEDEAWPARLAALRGGPVTNGGVPGYSTAQGLARLDAALALRPSHVLLAYLVRDADPAPRPDAARPGRAPPELYLLRAVRRAGGPRAPAAPQGATVRVPPAQYLANLRALVERVRAAGATVEVLAFPMLRPPAAHLAALEVLAQEVPVLRPSLPADSFFPEDPIHLTPEGHLRLAQALAEGPP